MHPKCLFLRFLGYSYTASVRGLKKAFYFEFVCPHVCFRPPPTPPHLRSLSLSPLSSLYPSLCPSLPRPGLLACSRCLSLPFSFSLSGAYVCHFLTRARSLKRARSHSISRACACALSPSLSCLHVFASFRPEQTYELVLGWEKHMRSCGVARDKTDASSYVNMHTCIYRIQKEV